MTFPVGLYIRYLHTVCCYFENIHRFIMIHVVLKAALWDNAELLEDLLHADQLKHIDSIGDNKIIICMF